MKEFINGDIVAFSGNVDNPESIESTTVAWANNAGRQAIIEHPEGHDGDQFSGKDLPSNKTFIFVNTKDIDLIKDAVTVDSVVQEKITVRPTESKFEPISVVLEVFKQNRPETDHSLIDKLIKTSVSEEAKSAAAEKKAREKTAAAEEKAQKKEKENQQIANAEVINEHAADRLKREKNQREEIVEIINLAVAKGLLVLNGADAIYKGVAMPTSSVIADAVDLSLYFQNVPVELTSFTLDVMKSNPVKGNVETPIAAEDVNKIAEGEGYPGGSKPEGVVDDTEDKENGTDESKNDTKEPKSDTKESENGTEGAKTPPEPTAKEILEAFKLKLHDLSGVGPKTVQDIVKLFPDAAALMQGHKDGKFEFTPKVNGKLKDACESNYFG